MKADLNSALIFVNVVKNGSFTKAAQSLSLPVSTVSDRVSALEEELGVTLLARTTRKLRLTEEGSALFRKAEGGVASVLAAFEEAKAAHSGPTGVLRLTAPVDMVPNELAAAILEYRAKFPKVRVEMHFSNRFVDLIAEGFDIAIRGGALDDSSLLAKRIGSGGLVLVASPEYVRKNPPLRHPRDLKDHACVGFLHNDGTGAGLEWVLRSAEGKTLRVPVEPRVACGSFQMVISVVRAGGGVGFIPKNLLVEDLRKNRVVQVLPEWGTQASPVHLVYPAQRFASPKVKEMLPILEKHLRASVNG